MNNGCVKLTAERQPHTDINRMNFFRPTAVSFDMPLSLSLFSSKNSSDLLFHLTLPDGACMYVSPSLSNLTGVTPREFYDNPALLRKTIHPDWLDYLLEVWKEFGQGVVRRHYEFQILDRAGHERWCNLRVFLERDAQGHPEAVGGLITDITNTKELEEELRLSRMEMEVRILKRTRDLNTTNSLLRDEVQVRQTGEQRIQALTQQLLSIQEEERQQIARDLHDNVAQDLSTATLALEEIGEGTDLETIITNVRNANRLLKNSIASIRTIAYGLRPSALDELGLVNTIRDYCDRFSRTYYPTVDFISAGVESLELNPEVQINLFRIVQEALDNVLKHSNADTVNIWLISSHPDLILRIEDNGCGFEDTTAPSGDKSRMGLQRMEERANLIGGNFSVQTKPGSGTRLTVKYTHERKGG